MCDSASLMVWLDPMTDEEYQQGQYPSKDLTDTDETWAHFRVQHPKSPLTGAGFTVTPIGMLIPGAGDKRRLYGRIAGYLVEVNGPADLIGQNRLLVNGVPQAARGAYWLLMYFLARNGCTQAGLNRVKVDEADLVDLTLTFLFLSNSEKQARENLREFREHSETVLNKKRKDGDKRKPVAFSVPPEPIGPVSEYTYTSYVKKREFMFSAYVKELNQPNAFLLPLADDALEAELQATTVRTLRVEVRVYGKWLKDNKLNRVAAWRGKSEPYEEVFGLLRSTLMLDKAFRSRRLKKTTIPNLKLSAGDKKYLAYHIKGGYVREHPEFMRMKPKKFSQYYSALRLRVLEKEGIDFDIPYADTKLLSPYLSQLLTYRGEFQPDMDTFEPDGPLSGYVFSRISVPVAIRKLRAIVAAVLKYGPDRVPPLPKHTVYNGPGQRPRPARGSGIGDAPLDPNAYDSRALQLTTARRAFT